MDFIYDHQSQNWPAIRNRAQQIQGMIIMAAGSLFERKEKANEKKHGISFDEAHTVFYDENAIQFFDPDHSDDEDRFILLGISFKLRILVICRCFRESDTVIRIIAARKADGDEENEYWRYRK